MPRYKIGKHTLLGAGMCGVVVTDGENRVRKIAKEAYLIHPYEFPWEYCVAMVIKSPHIIRVIDGSNLKLIVKLYFQVEKKLFFRITKKKQFLKMNIYHDLKSKNKNKKGVASMVLHCLERNKSFVLYMF